MTAHGDRQPDPSERLEAALIKLDVCCRRSEQRRLFASDGENEYEVLVSAGEADVNYGHRGASRLVVGKRTLSRLEGGDVSALFSWGIKRPVEYKPPISRPSSPSYRPLQWSKDAPVGRGDILEAQGGSWEYVISPVAGSDQYILGYRIRGHDWEESNDIGSLDIRGGPGERTLRDAKSAAQTDYAARYLEVEQLLYDIVEPHEDDEGTPLTRLDIQDRIIVQVEELGYEVEIAATLVDYGDFYDADARRWEVCPRSAQEYAASGDWLHGLLDAVRFSEAMNPGDGP